MADDSKDLEENYLTCVICYNVFTEPKTLVCLHRFCKTCLEAYLVRMPEATIAKRSFPCPVCREMNPAPDPRCPVTDWASLLRTDFHLTNLIKALKASGAGQGGKRIGGTSGGFRPCPTHTDKEQDLYCMDCSLSICHLCAGISHRGCSQVLTVSEVAKDRRASLELQCRNLADRLGTIAQLRANIDCQVDSVAAQHKKAEASIHQSCQAAIDSVLQQVTQQLQELKETYICVKEDLSQHLKVLDSKMAQRHEVLESWQKKMKSASDNDLVRKDTFFLNHSALDADEKKLNSILFRLKNIRLEFRPSANQSIKLGDVSLGMDCQTKKENLETKTPTNLFSKNPTTARPQLPPRRPRSKTLDTIETAFVTLAPVKLRTIPAQFREDQHSPKLRDVLVLSELKMVLVTDWANQCVKALHERRERVGWLGVGGKPWCLARLTDTAVAVSLPLSTRICVLKVTPHLALQSSFFVEKRYSGLATLSSDTLVASGGSDPPCVDIINLGGEVLRSISHDITTGQALFLYPAYLTLLPDRAHFVVSDRRQAAVTCLSTSGQARFLLQPEGNKALQEPQGVRSDKAGGIYVVEARGVVRVTSGGQLDRTVLRCCEVGLEDPCGLDFDEEGLLYVTNREEVVVFKIH